MENIKVLFVDDEVNVLNSLKRGLIYEDYECLFANSGEKALEILETEDVAVLVTDMRMPEMTGLALMKIVEEKYPKIVKIVLSGYTQITQVLATINQVDIFKFITKPWKLEQEFKGIINKAIEYYNLKRESEEIKKGLGIKNKAYVNIFNDITEKINDAKRSAEMIGECGKRIFRFNQLNATLIQENYGEIVGIENQVYEIIYQGALEAVRQLSDIEVMNELKIGIQDIVTISHLDIKENFGEENRMNSSQLIQVILAFSTIFKSIFSEYGLYITANVNPEGVHTIAFVSPNVYDEADSSSYLKINEIDIKISLYNAILKELAESLGYRFKVLKNQGNVIGVLELSREEVTIS